MGLLGSIAGATIGGLFGNHQANKQLEYQDKWNREQMAMQVEENQKNRDFNASQAEISRNFQKEMFDETNTYNSMQNQVSQMKAAGLNPALAYSGGAGFSPASAPSGATASSSSGYSPISAANVDTGAATLAGMRAISEIANIDAQTRKLNAEGSIFESDAKFRDAYNTGLVEGQNVSIDTSKAEKIVKEADAALKLKQIEQIDQDMSAFNKHLEMIQAQIDSVGLDNFAKRIENQFKTPMFEAQLKQLAAQTGLSTSQAFAIVQKLPYEIQSLGADVAYKNALSALTEKQGIVYDAQSNVLHWDAHIKEEDWWKKRNRNDFMKKDGSFGSGVSSWINSTLDFLNSLGK